MHIIMIIVISLKNLELIVSIVGLVAARKEGSTILNYNLNLRS